jgi:hypothetical protein
MASVISSKSDREKLLNGLEPALVSWDIIGARIVENNQTIVMALATHLSGQ